MARPNLVGGGAGVYRGLWQAADGGAPIGCDDQRRHHHDLGGGFDRRHIERGVMRTEDGVERWPRISPRPLCL